MIEKDEQNYDIRELIRIEISTSLELEVVSDHNGKMLRIEALDLCKIYIKVNNTKKNHMKENKI